MKTSQHACNKISVVEPMYGCFAGKKSNNLPLCGFNIFLKAPIRLFGNNRIGKCS
jgi:hypothetical protein